MITQVFPVEYRLVTTSVVGMLLATFALYTLTWIKYVVFNDSNATDVLFIV